MRPHEQPQKKRPADERRDDADRQLDRREQIVRATRVARDQERRAEQRRRRQHQPMIGADDQPHDVRHDEADERDRARRATPRRRSPATR